MAPIAIQYTTSKADIRRAALGSLTPWLRSPWLIGYLMLAMATYGFTYVSIGTLSPYGPLTVLGAPAVVGLSMIWSCDRAYGRLQDFQKHMTVEISGSGLKLADERQHSLLDWDSYAGWRISLGTLFLLPTVGNRIAIPTRVFSEVQLGELSVFLTERLAPARSV